MSSIFSVGQRLCYNRLSLDFFHKRVMRLHPVWYKKDIPLCKALVNIKDDQGDSILHKLVRLSPDHEPVKERLHGAVRLLLDNGADPHLQNKKGKTAYLAATSQEMHALLVDHAVKKNMFGETLTRGPF